MSEEHKYALVPADDVAGLNITQIQDTFEYDVIIEPTLLPDGDYLVEYSGNKPHTLYGTTVYTGDEVKAKRADPEDAWYVDPNMI